jgi:hypothetical protein
MGGAKRVRPRYNVPGGHRHRGCLPLEVTEPTADNSQASSAFVREPSKLLTAQMSGRSSTSFNRHSADCARCISKRA